MKTGKIVELKRKYAIVLNKSMHFERINIKKSMCVGQEIYYFEEDEYNSKLVFRAPMINQKVVYASILIIILLSVVGIYNVRNTPMVQEEVFAYVSIDINPSVELGVNRANKVMNYKALNDDGKTILSNELIGLELQIALDLLLSEAKDQGYLFDNDSIMITSTKVMPSDSNNDDITIEDIEVTLDTYMEEGSENYSFIYYIGEDIERLEAIEQGLSLGKYTMLKFYNSVSKLEPLNKEEIQELKMTDITMMLEEQNIEKEQLNDHKMVQYKSKALTESEDKENNGNGPNNIIEPDEKGKQKNGQNNSNSLDESNSIEPVVIPDEQSSSNDEDTDADDDSKEEVISEDNKDNANGKENNNGSEKENVNDNGSDNNNGNDNDVNNEDKGGDNQSNGNGKGKGK